MSGIGSIAKHKVYIRPRSPRKECGKTSQCLMACSTRHSPKDYFPQAETQDDGDKIRCLECPECRKSESTKGDHFNIHDGQHKSVHDQHLQRKQYSPRDVMRSHERRHGPCPRVEGYRSPVPRVRSQVRIRRVGIWRAGRASSAHFVRVWLYKVVLVGRPVRIRNPAVHHHLVASGRQ